MTELLEKILQIRYTSIQFTLTFPQDCIVPPSKTSALRGGIGQMLIASCCISEKHKEDCVGCDFQSECIVQRTMYSKFSTLKPRFVTDKESVGYVIECEDYRSNLSAGEEINFTLILFGKNIVYFSQYLNAIAALGNHGLGNSNARFYISGITNTRGQSLLQGNSISMSAYRIETLANYVKHRKKALSQMEAPNMLVFKSATAIRFQGKQMNHFDMNIIIQNVQRRLFILACFEDMEFAEEFFQNSFGELETLAQDTTPISVRRYSTRSRQAMYLNGIKGSVTTEDIKGDLLDLLLAGEVIHIGRNTSFGFGRYRLTHS